MLRFPDTKESVMKCCMVKGGINAYLYHTSMIQVMNLERHQAELEHVCTHMALFTSHSSCH
jgi:hypothetical protein